MKGFQNYECVQDNEDIRCGLPELLEIASHIPCIISVRSGVLDFLVKTDVNMFVIYLSSGINRKVYSMKDWKRNGLIEEVDIDNFLQDDSFERIDNFLQRISDNNAGKENE